VTLDAYQLSIGIFSPDHFPGMPQEKQEWNTMNNPHEETTGLHKKGKGEQDNGNRKFNK
jgi:hypothetical protein